MELTRMKLNQKVLLKKSYAKWHLDHPEVYMHPSTGELAPPYEEETLLHLMICMGVPVEGRVLGVSHSMERCWFVEFKLGRLKMSYYVERKDLQLL